MPALEATAYIACCTTMSAPLFSFLLIENGYMLHSAERTRNSRVITNKGSCRDHKFNWELHDMARTLQITLLILCRLLTLSLCLYLCKLQTLRLGRVPFIITTAPLSSGSAPALLEVSHFKAIQLS